MLTSDVLYIVEGKEYCNIKFSNKNEIKINTKLKDILNNCCLKDLSTLDGRINATKHIYNIKKYVPIYIEENIVLFPIKRKKEIENIYINSINVIDILKDNENTLIIFNDSSMIRISRPYHIIMKNYNVSMKIKKSNYF